MLVLTIMRWMSRTRGPLVVRGPQFDKHWSKRMNCARLFQNDPTLKLSFNPVLRVEDG
jgi:hypothetical protein